MSRVDLPAIAPPLLVSLIDDFTQSVMRSRSRDQLIDREDDPYLERWYLARKAMVPGNSPNGHYDDQVPLISSELENLYIHRYARADREEPHCHPWPNATLVVRGEYVEDVYKPSGGIVRLIRSPGDIVLRDAAQVHAIVDVEPGTVSLFATMRKERDWGFYTADGFIPWAQFRAWKQERAA